ncbi:acyl carrier protein [Paenibacillus vini]|uniref:acyl carrier protein n=1 Tax=Paenibacillus vini TaxID=1476024 RepID=UPI0025B72461|nr:acyl carrier protein [Paenibacillus vini]MDN4066701.1 acyl carrier protein [Paenibacillus vini]
MERCQLINIVNSIIKEVAELHDETIIGLDDPLSDYGINSFLSIKLLVRIESTFEFELIDEDLLIENFSTTGKVVELICKYVSVC